MAWLTGMLLSGAIFHFGYARDESLAVTPLWALLAIDLSFAVTAGFLSSVGSHRGYRPVHSFLFVLFGTILIVPAVDIVIALVDISWIIY